MINQIAVISINPANMPAAQALAQQLHLPFLSEFETATAQYDYWLVVTDAFIGLQATREKRFAPFHIDFQSGKLFYRSQQAGLRKELVARAMGMNPRENPTIIDATAGLGRDSFILAKLGFNVTMLERSLILFTLLQDALSRAQHYPSTQPIVQHLNLIHADAKQWLSGKAADIIYLDPMFPERQKTASVKKEMAILQDLLGKDEDAQELFKVALSCARRRVVVKRPRLAPTITTRAPSYSLPGKSSRFDVYISPNT